MSDGDDQGLRSGGVAIESGRPRASLSELIIRLGAIASAITAIVGAVYLFVPRGEKESADISIESIYPRDYGAWLSDEKIAKTGFTKDELAADGIEVTYVLTTGGFGRRTELPVSLRLNGSNGHDLQRMGDPLVLAKKGDGCRCIDWLPLDPHQNDVQVSIQVDPPGAPHQEAIAGDDATYCPRSGTMGPCG